MKRADIRIGVVLAALLLSVTGCHLGGGAGSAAPAPPPAATSTYPPGSPVPTPAAGTAPPGATTASPASAPSTGAATARCHARGRGLYVLPDPSCTPGATDPAVTQADIDQTICRSGWTETVRPPESYTEPLKYRQMDAYGDTGSARAFEEDHFIPLELGGSPTSTSNLWPEPGGSPNPKDSVEDAARRAVCDGRMTLAYAQHAIAADWIAFGDQLGIGQPQAPTVPESSRPGS